MSGERSNKRGTVHPGDRQQAGISQINAHDALSGLYVETIFTRALNELAKEMERYLRAQINDDLRVLVEHISAFQPDKYQWAIDGGSREFFVEKMTNSHGFIAVNRAYVDLATRASEGIELEIPPSYFGINLGDFSELYRVVHHFFGLLEFFVSPPRSLHKIRWHRVRAPEPKLPTKRLFVAEIDVRLDDRVGKILLAIPSNFIVGFRELTSRCDGTLISESYHAKWISAEALRLIPLVLKSLLDNYEKRATDGDRTRGGIARKSTYEPEGAVGRRFAKFLKDNGIDEPRMPDLLGAFLAKNGFSVVSSPDAERDSSATVSAPPLPKRAPERWPSDPAKRTETSPVFATRVYRVWMDAGVLTRQALKDLDPLLFASVDNWLKNNRRKPKPEPLPEGFKLLTLAEANDAWIERIEAQNSNLSNDAGRLAAAKRRRIEKAR